MLNANMLSVIMLNAILLNRRLTFKRLPFTRMPVFWILIIILLNVILQNVVSPSIFLIDVFHHSSRIIHQPDFPICFSVSSLSRIGEEPIAVKMELTLHQLKPVAKKCEPFIIKTELEELFHHGVSRGSWTQTLEPLRWDDEASVLPWKSY